ncbi:MAG: DUF4397 domain-containing protein [Bacteroidetes bacterium]|jgi:hypothetical protein|nr:DUF4397 domain-containing protein [Bacteroidota bacterium]
MTLKKSLLALLLATAFSAESMAQAELQVIHNCADPAAATVDVYINGTLTLNDFAFRTATSFLTVPSGVNIDIGIAPGNSTSANDTIVNIPRTFVQNERYVAIASGVLTPSSFATNPDAVNTNFRLRFSANIRNAAQNAGEVDLKVFHGATDAPTVDVLAQGAGVLIDDAAYTDFAPYISVPAGDYLLDITPGNNNSVVVATFSAELNGLAGGAAVVFASGFLDPSQNQNGADFGLFAALPSGAVVTLNKVGNARLQVIHNAADPAAASVDVYVNGALLLDNFNFREATPFIDVNSGQTLNIGIAGGNSTSANDTLVNIPVVLNDGGTYVAVANGVLNPANFSVNPEGISTGFQLLLFSGMQETGLNGANVDLAVLHGATDAPAVDVYARNVAQLIDSITYTSLQGYINVPAADYLLDITPAAGSPIIATYFAPLSGLTGGAAVVFASGFLDPANNQNGEAFGLFAALPNGTVIALNDTSNSRLQVIHNSADPAASTVDIYVNGGLLLNDFAFRAATPYIDVPSGVVINIGVAPGTSSSVNDTLVNIPVTLMNGATYVAIASGVLNPASFAVNPDAVPTGFQLILSDGMRESANNAGEVDFRVLHGATDAPGVDVAARNVATLVNGASYTDFTGYINVPANTYLLDVKAAGTNTIVASFTAPLSLIPDQSAVVFASGFLNPATNQNGEAFGLFAALADGSVVTFPATSAARLQVIHNCADPVADSVDVYVNGTLLLDNFAFRTATPFIDIAGDTPVEIGIAPKTSASANDTIVNYTVTFVNGETYVAIASGVLTPGSFAVNPDGRPTGFTLLLQNQMRETALNSTDVDFRAVHGSTDAPTVDVVAVGAGVIVNDAAYTDITPYISVPASTYTLEVTPGNNNSIIVAAYAANLSTLGGGTAVVFASGFLDPATNQNGEAFGLYAALVDGTVIAFPVVTGVNEINNDLLKSAYPNPATDMLNIVLQADVVAEAINITDITGKIVLTQPVLNNSNTLTVDVKSLSAGTYLMNIVTNGQIAVQRFNVVK